jgi:hypothetical protein
MSRVDKGARTALADAPRSEGFHRIPGAAFQGWRRGCRHGRHAAAFGLPRGRALGASGGHGEAGGGRPRAQPSCQPLARHRQVGRGEPPCGPRRDWRHRACGARNPAPASVQSVRAQHPMRGPWAPTSAWASSCHVSDGVARLDLRSGPPSAGSFALPRATLGQPASFAHAE